LVAVSRSSSLEELIRKIRSTYLRNEEKYDKWGAQGKTLVAEEVLSREGVKVFQKRMLQLVNIAFPRTFFCLRYPRDKASLPRQNEVNDYFSEVLETLSMQAMNGNIAEVVALEETAEKFCLPVEVIKDYLWRKEN